MKHRLIWITGLSGAGKTSIAVKVFSQLKVNFANTILVDGDSVREIFCNDLGHNLEDRVKNAWRIVRLCKYICDQEINVVCATMSLYKEIHDFIYEKFDNPLVVYLDVPMAELVKRNKKNLYSDGINVSGRDLPYDEPRNEKYVMKLTNDSGLDKTVNIILDRVKL
jgi:adenylylsulfate kinase